jgi:hypothetical protein
MTPNDAGRSPRTEHEQPMKRGANTAYLTSRLARDHPQILARLQAGEFPSVRAAAKAAGLIPERTPLEQLERAWRQAPPEDRATFLALRQSATPLPPRLRRVTGAIWHERMVMVRQHLLMLRQTGLVPNLARSWTPDTRRGYAAELRPLINDLTQVLAQVESVMEEPVRGERAESVEAVRREQSGQDQDRTP